MVSISNNNIIFGILLLLSIATITTMTIASRVASATTTTSPLSVAPPPSAFGPDRDVEVVPASNIIQSIISSLYNVALIDYQLYENGTAIYTFRAMDTTTGQIASDESQTMQIRTIHTATPENG